MYLYNIFIILCDIVQLQKEKKFNKKYNITKTSFFFLTLLFTSDIIYRLRLIIIL
jgi:hypothetical protein